MPLTRWIFAALLALLILFAIVVAVRYFEKPWVQVVGDSVLRTNGDEKVVADAENSIVEKHQHYVTNAEGKRSDPSRIERARSWGSGPSPKRITAEVGRGMLEITDENGHHLAVERITSTNAPTLLFIEFDGPGGGRGIIEELLVEFQSRGLAIR